MWSQDFQSRKSQNSCEFHVLPCSFSLPWCLVSCLTEEVGFVLVVISLLPVLMTNVWTHRGSKHRSHKSFYTNFKKYISEGEKVQFETHHVASQYNVISNPKLGIKGRGALSFFQGEFFPHGVSPCDTAAYLPHMDLFLPFSKKVRNSLFTSSSCLENISTACSFLSYF